MELQSIEAEQMLIGVLLLNNNVYDTIADFLRPFHFANSHHSKIFAACVAKIENGDLADPVTLKSFVDNSLKDIGGYQYLLELASAATVLSSIEDYGRIIYDLYIKRQLVDIGQDLVNNSVSNLPDIDADYCINKVEQRLFDLTMHQNTEAIDFKTAMKSAINMAEIAYKKDHHISGITTGLLDLDKWLGGMHKSDLMILAGRPSMGKTALATNIAFNAASAVDGNGAGVLFFSLEMSAEQLATRILSQESGIASDKIRRGEIKSEDFDKFISISRTMNNISLYIDDRAGLSVSSIRTTARRMMKKHNIGVIVIDYLQLLSAPIGKKTENRVQEISDITRMLKGIAKELNVPVLALSQLSRAVEQREDKRPQLSDLRESGTIEQDADIVMFIYREEYYEMRKEPEMGTEKHNIWQQKMEAIHGVAELIISKQRHGPVGTVRLFYDSNHTKFGNLIRKNKEKEQIE